MTATMFLSLPRESWPLFILSHTSLQAVSGSFCSGTTAVALQDTNSYQFMAALNMEKSLSASVLVSNRL